MRATRLVDALLCAFVGLVGVAVMYYAWKGATGDSLGAWWRYGGGGMILGATLERYYGGSPAGEGSQHD